MAAPSRREKLHGRAAAGLAIDRASDAMNRLVRRSAERSRDFLLTVNGERVIEVAAAIHCRPAAHQRHHVGAERFRETQTDLGARHRPSRERGQREEVVQPPLALHARQGSQCGHDARLLLRPVAHRQRSPRVALDPHPTVLLREGSQGEETIVIWFSNNKKRRASRLLGPNRRPKLGQRPFLLPSMLLSRRPFLRHRLVFFCSSFLALFRPFLRFPRATRDEMSLNSDRVAGRANRGGG